MTDPAQTILLLGDSGQLGTALQLLFSSTAASGSTFIRGSDYQLDLGDREVVLAILNDVRPEIIINAAAYTAVDLAEQEREQAFRVNADGPATLAKWCADHNATLIHISTDYVFAGDKPLYQAYSEDDPVSPVSVYGQSKLAGEQHIQSAMQQNYAILRTAWLYGAQGKNFIKTMLRLVCDKPEQTFKVVDDQYGSPTSTAALARQILMLLDKRYSAAGLQGVYHATSTGHCSWYQFACEFFALMQIDHNLVPCSTEEYPTPARRPANSILANSRLADLGVDSFVPWQDDLAQFVAAFGEQLLTTVQKN